MTDPLETREDARALPAVAAVYATTAGHDPGWRRRWDEAAREILYAPLREAGVTPGAFEARTLDWLAGFEQESSGAVANLFRRMYEAGKAARDDG